MVIAFQLSIEHFFIRLKIENQILDIDLVSPEDFTLHFYIEKELWEKFLETYDETVEGNKSNLIAFRNSLIECFNKEIDTREQDPKYQSKGIEKSGNYEHKIA